MKEFDDYFKKWKAQEVKPKNEPEFVEIFKMVLDKIEDAGEVEFCGEGAYFGTSFTINLGGHLSRPDVELEIAISSSSMSVYTGRHDGFWVPEFITTNQGDGLFYLRDLFVKKMSSIMGLK